MTDKLSLKLITTDAAFYALEPEWLALEQAGAVPNVFLSWEWMSSWWRHFGEVCSLWVLAARQQERGELVGLAPLCIRQRQIGPIRYRELTFIG